jgi:hypothetical protein
MKTLRWRVTLVSTPVRRDGAAREPARYPFSQARIHPRAYLAGIAKALVALGAGSASIRRPTNSRTIRAR